MNILSFDIGIKNLCYCELSSDKTILDWRIINISNDIPCEHILKNKNKSQEILKLAVKRMLPGGPLAKKQLTKLKIYSGEKHPHDIQKPKIIEFDKLNKKNIVRN